MTGKEPALLPTARNDRGSADCLLHGFDKALPLTLLARAIHRKLHLPIICYTGYTLEELVQKARTRTDIRGLLTSIDTLLDGPFIQEKKSLDLEWRGSSNQRIISAAEIKTSLKA